MMKKATGKALLYRFENEGKLEAVKSVMHGLNIATEVLPNDAWRQKIGYLLHIKGFQPVQVKEVDEVFFFPEEVMLLYQVKGKRLDQVLQALHDANIPQIRYKAVITPFNTLWTLRRLCETMQKEHGTVAASLPVDKK